VINRDGTGQRVKIDYFEFVDTQVSVQAVTWGRVRALFR